MVYQISCVLVRLFAIYWFLVSVRLLNTFFYFLVFASQGTFDLNFLSLLANLFICIFLFFKPSIVLIGLDFKDRDFSVEPEKLTSAIQSAGVALIGFSFLLSGLGGLINSAVLMAANKSYQHVVYLEPTFVEDLTAVIGGLILIACSGGVSKWITWLRTVRPKADMETSEPS